MTKLADLQTALVKGNRLIVAVVIVACAILLIARH